MSITVKEREVLTNFRTNIRQILRAQNLSEAELSRRAGFEDEGALAAMLQADSLPNMVAPMRLADALGVPMEALLREEKAHLKPDFEALPVEKVDREAARLLCAVFKATERAIDGVTNRPTLDSIIAWWKDSDGDLSSSDQISPHFDLVRAADALSAIPTVDHVGALGLSAMTLGSSANARLESFLRTLSMSDLEELNKNIRTVARTGIGMVTPQTRIVTFPETNETLEVSFVRLMLPVRDTAGIPFVLNYSTLLSESTPRKLDG
jgi:transcriptional regulator with XRE-family HTH domain